MLSLVLLSGCATAISTSQPADTLPRGDYHVGAALNGNLPVTRIYDVLDEYLEIQAKLKADPSYRPTEEEQRAVARAVVGLIAAGPGVGNDFMLRYGVLHGLDAGVRYTTTGLHLDAKWQFLDHESGWVGSVSLGGSRHFFSGLIFDALSLVQIDDFSRTDLEIPLLFGRDLGTWGKTWFGPKYVLAKYSVDAKLQNIDETFTPGGLLHYAGGVGGFAVGRYGIYAFAELTTMYMIASPEPVVLGEQIDVGGLVLMPSAGLMARF